MTQNPPSTTGPGKISGRDLQLAGMGLLVLFLLAGFVYSFVLPAVGRFPDEKEYLALSDHLAHGPGYSMDGMQLTASRAPGYPFFLEPFAMAGIGVVGFRLIQFVLLAATILLVQRLCAPQQGYGVLLLVTGLVLIYPVLFYTSATLYPQTLAEFLFVAALVQLLAGNRGVLLDLTTGLTFGALILVMPTFALTLGVVLAVAWILKLVRIRNGVIMVLAAGLIIAPWAARNAVEFHRFVPFATNSGENLLIGNSEETTPYGGMRSITLSHYGREAQRLGLDEFQRDRYYRQSALDWIERHPVRATVLYFGKTLNYFNGWNEYASANAAEVSAWKQAVMAASYAVLLALLAWRLIEVKRFPLSAREKLFLLVYVLSAFTMAIFTTRIRYRLPYDFLIIAVIAMHLSRHLQLRFGVRDSVEHGGATE